jgi:hypothetical protein
MSVGECRGQAIPVRLLTVAVLLISACGSTKTPTAIEAAEATVLVNLRNPAQVKFAHERIVSNGERVVCGLVNAMQPSGAYTGWRRFYVSGDPPRARIDVGGSATQHAFDNTDPEAAVSYESFWNSAGCRDSDEEPGPIRRMTSWLG